jgi:glycosyltransferase involved in cell wall biosynthesis
MGQPMSDMEGAVQPAVRFSVIIIFHNQREFVRTAMDSALGQSADGVEVIAVDDGSSDGTRVVLNEYRDRARLILLDENRGACAARDAGTQVATGDYLAYLDGDDAFMPWAIQTYRRVAEKYAPALMMGPMHWFEGAVPEPGPAPQSIDCVPYDDYFAKERVVDVSASAIVVRRRAMESVGGWEGFPVDDLHLLYRLGTAGPFVQVTEPSTTLHRSHAGQIIRQSDQIIKGAEWIIANDRHGRYPGGDARRLERRACIGGIVIHWARMHAQLGARRHAVRFLVKHRPYVLAALATRAQRSIRGSEAPRTEALWASATA